MYLMLKKVATCQFLFYLFIYLFLNRSQDLLGVRNGAGEGEEGHSPPVRLLDVATSATLPSREIALINETPRIGCGCDMLNSR